MIEQRQWKIMNYYLLQYDSFECYYYCHSCAYYFVLWLISYVYVFSLHAWYWYWHSIDSYCCYHCQCARNHSFLMMKLIWRIIGLQITLSYCRERKGRKVGVYEQVDLFVVLIVV